MATYCYRCPDCGNSYESRSYAGVICACGEECVRDYRAEGVSATGMVALKQEREGQSVADRARLVLPTNSDFAGPGDPDGTKGMREWRDSVVPYQGHGDREANTKPFWPGEVERKLL